MLQMQQGRTLSQVLLKPETPAWALPKNRMQVFANQKVGEIYLALNSEARDTYVTRILETPAHSLQLADCPANLLGCPHSSRFLPAERGKCLLLNLAFSPFRTWAQCFRKQRLAFPTWAWQNGSYKEGEKKGCSAINKVVTKEYTTNVHKHILGVGFKKHVPRGLKEIRKFARKEMGTPDVCIDTRLNKSVWAKGIRNVPYHFQCSRAQLISSIENSLSTSMLKNSNPGETKMAT
ncbi:hypothetical protein QTO34_007885 [Cnephaeus nilssonii]|uniref:Large ribosomal subunit protein eL31 n=1 Tax=Cnephaeus nilssonii TaxID=3371016 RepID=A0AA40I9A8_CNENI|nr:hypothetical protein QTO34_007885 [Eptesicus nilssonii]